MYRLIEQHAVEHPLPIHLHLPRPGDPAVIILRPPPERRQKHLLDRPDRAFLQRPAKVHHAAAPQVLHLHRPDFSRPLLRRDHPLHIAGKWRHGLFHQHMLARLKCRDSHLRMKMMRRADIHRLHPRVRQHCLKRGIDGQPLGLQPLDRNRHRGILRVTIVPADQPGMGVFSPLVEMRIADTTGQAHLDHAHRVIALVGGGGLNLHIARCHGGPHVRGVQSTPIIHLSRPESILFFGPVVIGR